MKRSEFDSCMEEAKRMFNQKEISPYVADIFFDEFSNIERDLFMKALASTVASGLRFTIENLFAGLEKIRKSQPPKERIRTDCSTCGGDGAIVANNYAYSCNCKAGENYASYPKYNNHKDESLKITEFKDYYVREFNGYEIKVPKSFNSVKDLIFEHENSLLPKVTSIRNKNEFKKPNFGEGL